MPHSPSLEASIAFYHKLFTGSPTDMAEALAWDLSNALEKKTVFYAWEDTNTRHYIVHDDGKKSWTFPQEQARTKQAKKSGAAPRPQNSSPRKSPRKRKLNSEGALAEGGEGDL